MKTFSIIIPIYKDTELAKDKISNILSLEYPSELVEIIIAHGGAKSNRIRKVNNMNPLLRIIHIKRSGKINQVNTAMQECLGEIVLITDVDALMEVNCLKELNKAYEDPEVQVVGAWTNPGKCTLIDKAYWYIANWIRVLESKFHSCSHITGCCVSFRKELLSSATGSPMIPWDVIADDVYIPFYASFGGGKVKYLRSTKVLEVRQPTTLGSFYPHKMRKGNAVLRELLRFMYLIAYVNWRMKLIYLLRLFQFTALTPLIFITYPFMKQTSQYRKVR